MAFCSGKVSLVTGSTGGWCGTKSGFFIGSVHLKSLCKMFHNVTIEVFLPSADTLTLDTYTSHSWCIFSLSSQSWWSLGHANQSRRKPTPSYHLHQHMTVHHYIVLLLARLRVASLSSHSLIEEINCPLQRKSSDQDYSLTLELL